MFYPKSKHFVIFRPWARGSQQCVLIQHSHIRLSATLVRLLIISLVLLVSSQSIAPVSAKVIASDEVTLAGKHYPYLYEWKDNDIKARAVIIAIHGILMHGRTY